MFISIGTMRQPLLMTMLWVSCWPLDKLGTEARVQTANSTPFVYIELMCIDRLVAVPVGGAVLFLECTVSNHCVHHATT